jgi:membrane protein YdbS with pleckstrin-like domain
MDCTMTSQDWMLLIALLVLIGLPAAVLPFWTARKLWRIPSLPKRLVVMHAALLMLLLATNMIVLIKPNSSSLDTLSSLDTSRFTDFLKELIFLIGPLWIVWLITGVFLAYAPTVVLFVLPDCRFRRWLFEQLNVRLRANGSRPR